MLLMVLTMVVGVRMKIGGSFPIPFIFRNDAMDLTAGKLETAETALAIFNKNER